MQAPLYADLPARILLILTSGWGREVLTTFNRSSHLVTLNDMRALGPDVEDELHRLLESVAAII